MSHATQLSTESYADALGHEQEALRQFQTTLSQDCPELIRAWASLASVQYMMSQPQEARISIERALRSAERTYGGSHPFLAGLLESDAIILTKLELKKEASLARHRARRIRGTIAVVDQEPLTWSVWEARAPDRKGQVRLGSR